MTKPTQVPVNLASLPLAEAMTRARLAGRKILGDKEALSSFRDDLSSRWVDTNLPISCGQSDDEFLAFSEQCTKEFEAGLDEAVSDARNAATARPNPFEGEDAATGAGLIIRALKWMSGKLEVDANREDIDDYQTLIELGLNALESEVETARRAFSEFRSVDGGNHA